jgi:hypothetical protein
MRRWNKSTKTPRNTAKPLFLKTRNILKLSENWLMLLRYIPMFPQLLPTGRSLGLGAEIGISTQKLHARGPMALEELTSYKWIIEGDGQVRPK